MTTLGELGGGFSLGTAMSESGDVVGYGTTGQSSEVPFDYSASSATMYRLTDLITAADAADWNWDYATPTGVNSSGQICLSVNASGTSGPAEAVRVSLVFDASGNVMPGQGTVSVVSPSGYQANDINEFGDVAGYGNGRAFIAWSDTGFEEIPDTVGGATAGASAINLLGELTGASLNSDGALRAFIYSAPNMTDLGIIESSGSDNESAANDLNDAGIVVGYASAGKKRGSPVSHAFLYDGTMHDLGTLGGASSSAYSVNNQGTVVGYSQKADGTSAYFLHTDDLGMVELAPLITNLPEGAEFVVVEINDGGQILGNVYYGAGIAEPCLLTPN